MRTDEIMFIKDTVFGLLRFEYDGSIQVKKSDSITVEATKRRAVIGCSKKNELARAFFLMAKEFSSGEKNVNIVQKPSFEKCGVMLDFSRGLIYKVSAVKKFIANMAALGMNMLLLYLEDTYEIKEYPYFGCMRGRYTEEEISEIDDYAEKLGIELIPCVQTLAHLRIYLKWQEAAEIRDSAEVLLVGEEKTYDFIKTMIRTLSRMFKSRRIHLGMDEAHTMGQGKYSKLHTVVDKKKMFIDHLGRVKKICEDEGLSPMIWSDMIFRLCGGEGGVNEEYDPKSVITPDIENAISGLNLTYWDYYRTSREEYTSIIKRHQKLNTELSFAGAVWTWDGYLPNFRYTFDTMHPAMKACLDCKIKEVYATLWGTNGTDTDYIQAISGLTVFSEYCFLGSECTEENVLSAAEFLTGINREILFASSEFFMGYDGAVGIGERFVDADILFEQIRYDVDYQKAEQTFENAIIKLKQYDNDAYGRYARLLLEIALGKCRVFMKLRNSYQSKDIHMLKQITEKSLPELIELYEIFFASCESIMEENRKPFGTEIIQIRFAGIKKRLEYAQCKLQAYVDGKINIVEELEEKALNNEYETWLTAESFMKTM